MLALLAVAATLFGVTASAGSSSQERVRVEYGDGPEQFGDLWLPTDGSGARPTPVVVLIHGGFWYNQYGLDLMEALAADLVERGVAVWNIEYRRIGDPGGGWPGTLTDVADAVDELDALADTYHLDVSDVVVVGHSAGGQLAFWLAGRGELDASAPGADPVVEPAVVIGLGPVSDLANAERDGVGAGAVGELLGGEPDEVPERYDVATPVIAEGVRAVVVRGGDDTIVPAAYTVPDGGGDIEVVDIDGDDHFDLIDPASESWGAVLTELDLS